MPSEVVTSGAEGSVDHNAGVFPAPVVSRLQGFGSLEEEYRDAPGFLEGIAQLKRSYKCMRRVRGDGNCFYRALLFGYVEALSSGLASGSLEARREHDRIINLVRSCPEELVAVGYDEFTFEIFHEMFLDLLVSLPREVPSHDAWAGEHGEGAPEQEAEGWLAEFCADTNADYYTWFMRLLTACSLKRHSERYLPFVEGSGAGEGMQGFCAREVEPMGVECEHVQIAALTDMIGVRVDIEYVDGRTRVDGDMSACISFPSEAEEHRVSSFPPVKLLYRPGHYDILYSK